MRKLLLGLLATIILAMSSAAASADDWTVTRLRGTVEQLVAGQWQPLERGSVVPDERSVFTRSNGYATLVRGNEAIELGPNTKIEIYDRGGRKPFTTILQYAGTLTVEAEVRNVQHFAVKTAYLAAVVKGTRFTVTARRSGGSVEVFRGQVSVEDEQSGETVLILPGQKASVAKSGMKVTGKPKATGKPAGNGKSSGASNSNAGGNGKSKDSTDKSVDKTEKSTQKAEDKAAKSEEKSSDGATVVETTTSKVAQVVETTADTVDDVVDKTTDTVDQLANTVDEVTNTTVVGTTVGTVTSTLDTTTKGLTGLLGKKPKGS